MAETAGPLPNLPKNKAQVQFVSDYEDDGDDESEGDGFDYDAVEDKYKKKATLLESDSDDELGVEFTIYTGHRRDIAKQALYKAIVQKSVLHQTNQLIQKTERRSTEYHNYLKLQYSDALEHIEVGRRNFLFSQLSKTDVLKRELTKIKRVPEKKIRKTEMKTASKVEAVRIRHNKPYPGSKSIWSLGVSKDAFEKYSDTVRLARKKLLEMDLKRNVANYRQQLLSVTPNFDSTILPEEIGMGETSSDDSDEGGNTPVGKYGIFTDDEEDLFGLKETDEVKKSNETPKMDNEEITEETKLIEPTMEPDNKTNEAIDTKETKTAVEDGRVVLGEAIDGAIQEPPPVDRTNSVRRQVTFVFNSITSPVPKEKPNPQVSKSLDSSQLQNSRNKATTTTVRSHTGNYSVRKPEPPPQMLTERALTFDDILAFNATPQLLLARRQASSKTPIEKGSAKPASRQSTLPKLQRENTALSQKSILENLEVVRTPTPYWLRKSTDTMIQQSEQETKKAFAASREFVKGFQSDTWILPRSNTMYDGDGGNTGFPKIKARWTAKK